MSVSVVLMVAGCKDGKLWGIFESASSVCSRPTTTDSVPGIQRRYIIVSGKKYFCCIVG